MTENELKNLLAAVTPPDEAARAAAHAHWAALTTALWRRASARPMPP